MASVPAALLSSDDGERRIPLVGYGTAEFSSPDTARRAILDAIEVGYRHIDTAAVYRSEKPIGDAVADALNAGIIRSREDLFITSKLWPNDAHRHLVLPALRKTLQNLGMEYVDLYLIHWPVSLKAPGKVEFPVKKEDLIPMDFKSVWEAMEECRRLGLAKSIGVSNFSSKKLEQLLSTAKIPPAVNQVELNPMWQQKELRAYCKAKGIHITAYSPLGSGSNRLMECTALKEIAHAKGKTVAQVCLRWIYEEGASAVTKSGNRGRMKENLEIVGWQLTAEEAGMIDVIPQQRGCPGDGFISHNGPFKTQEELWDD